MRGCRTVFRMFRSGLVVLLLTGCGPSGFHLRGDIALPEQYQGIYLQGVDSDSDFAKDIRNALQEVGSDLVASPTQARSVLAISNYQSGKRVAGYGDNREVRQYLIFLKLDYRVLGSDGRSELLPKEHINIDKTQVYDSQFVLGKVEEERLINETLRKDAARRILIRLRYGNGASGR